MDASERKKAVNEMVDKERELYTTIKTENDYLKIALKLAKAQQEPEKLEKILYSLQIGNKRDYNKDLRAFIKADGNLKTPHKEAFYELLKESDETYKKIQEEICTKLGYTDIEIEEARQRKEESEEIGIEDPRGLETDESLDREKIIDSLLGRKVNQADTKNSMDDFKTVQAKLSLKSSLTGIKTSLHIIEENLTHIDISKVRRGSHDAKVLAHLVKRSKTSSANWIEYLINEKVNKRFMLHENTILTLFNETIEPAKRTWEIASIMEKEMIAAGLTTEEEQKASDENVPEDIKNADFNVTPYWSDSVVRTSQIEREVAQEDISATYSGNPIYNEDKGKYLKYKYFDDVFRSKRDREKARRGQGIDFKVTKREIAITSGLRRMLGVYYKIPEDMRDTIEKATKSFGLRGNGMVMAVIGWVMGRVSKDPEIIFTSGDGPSPDDGPIPEASTSRQRHRQFTEEMGGPEDRTDRESEESREEPEDVREEGEEIEP